MKNESITIGTTVRQPSGARAATMVCDHPQLRRHVDRPWFRAYLHRHLGSSLANGDRVSEQTATVSDAVLARHALICGATGSGKSRLLEHLVIEQLRRGCSLVLVDPMGKTADRILARVIAEGISPRSVTLLDPRLPGVPGWNPLATGIPLAQAVSDLVALLEAAATSWGPRLQDLLTNALLLVGSHGLSLYELARLLTREDYRQALLTTRVHPPDRLAYSEACGYFRDEFGLWSRSERAQAVSPVLNKIRELLRSAFLRPLLCARRNSVDFRRHWTEQSVTILRLDRAALGEEGSRLLAGLLAHLLFRTALRASGPVPVVFAVDETPVVERFIGTALTQIVAMARGQGLRCIVACQHLAQLSEGLRTALLANAALQVFFRVGYADAKLIAASLAAGIQPQVTRVVVDINRMGRQTGLPEQVEMRHPIRDACGRPLRLNPAVWTQFQWNDLFGRDSVNDLRALAAAAGVTRLYVQAPDSQEPVALTDYVAGLRPSEYRIDGPTLQLVIAFPRPKLTGIERSNESETARAWTHALQTLPVQHAIFRVAGAAAGVVRVVNVPNRAIDPHRWARFVTASRAANAQSIQEIEATIRWREQQVERLATGRLNPGEEIDDGSLP